MPEEKRVEKGKVSDRYWIRTGKEAFKNDPIRIIIELIKNAADSYTRLSKKKENKPPFEIFVKIVCSRKTPPVIEVKDLAEGMDSKKLGEALEYGVGTSNVEDVDASTSAEKGLGLKQSMMAMKGSWLTTIKNNLINERSVHSNFNIGFGKENEKTDGQQRKEYGIPENGTIVRGNLPEYFHERKFETICDHLQKHFLLRKLLQNTDYKIFVSGIGGEKKLLEYRPPQMEKQLLNETFKINYGGQDYPIQISINKSKNILDQNKPGGDGGLLFIYGEYSVADFSLCGFERDPSFSKIFGEVKMGIEKLIRNDSEILIDEKRMGLILEHPFVKKLFDQIHKQLKNVREEETSEYVLDDSFRKNILKELNKVCKQIKGPGPPPELHIPIKPEIFEFYPVFISVKEFEQKPIFLVINSSKIEDDKVEIHLTTTNGDIEIKKQIVEVKKNEAKDGLIIKQIGIYSEKAGIEGRIIGNSEKLNYSTEAGIEVLENPIFSPKNGFAFVPDKTTIVDHGEKKVELFIKKDIIEDSKEISFDSTDPINCPGKIKLPTNLEKNVIKNVVKVEIPIKVKGKDKIGEKSVISASYKNKVTTLNVIVVPEPSFGGLFRDIKLSPRETKRITGFIEDEGIIEIYQNHPLIKQYMKKDFKNKQDFSLFIVDTITREAIRAIVTSAIRENLSTFPILDIDHPEQEIDNYFIQRYYENGTKMHEIFKGFVKALKIEG